MDHEQHPPLERDRDTGASFVEVLVAVVLLGVGGIAVLGAVAAAATSAATNRELAAVQASLASAADAVEAADAERDTYVACARPADYAGLVADLGVAVTGVEYWTGLAWSSEPRDCAFDRGQRLQRVTLESSVDDVRRSLLVVKRPADDPDTDVAPMTSAPAGSSELGASTPTPTPGIDGPVDGGDGNDDGGDRWDHRWDGWGD